MSRTVRLGIFIVATLGVLAAGSFLIGQRQLLFSRTFRVETDFKAVDGLIQGAEVRIGGIHKGVVDRIDLPMQPDGPVRVTMKIDRTAHDLIRADSAAAINTEGLLGSKYVDISFGSPDAERVADGGRIPSEPPVDFNTLIKQAGQTLDNVQEGSEQLKQIASKMNSGQGTFGALLNDKKMYQRLNETSEQAKAGAAAFQENMQALKHNFLIRGFFNDRGYEDATKLTADEIPRLPANAPDKGFHYSVKDIFADVSHAKFKTQKPLNDAGRYLETTPFKLAVVVAANDMKGDANEVLILTQARAMVVRDYLVKNFKMDDTRVKTLGLGKNAETPSPGTIDVLVYRR